MNSKNDAPKPTPVIKQKFYSLSDLSDFSYKIKFDYCTDKLIIDIEQEDSFPQLFFNSTISFEEIKKKDKWFRQFDTFEEAMDTVDGLFEERRVKIVKQENNINIILTHLEKKINDTIFTIEKKKEPEEVDLLPNLINSHNELRKRVKVLEKENLLLKQNLDKLFTIPIISNYMMKNSQKFLDGIIKNEEDKKLIFSWINPNTEKIKTNLIYSARLDGDDAQTFHKLCDNMGPTLVIIKSNNGKIFGGFTRENWAGNGYKYDKDAFLFSLEKRLKANSSNNNNSIYCNITYGPTFGGGHDLYICSGCLKKNASYNNNNFTYVFGNNPAQVNNGFDGFGWDNNQINLGKAFNAWGAKGKNNDLAGSYNFICNEVEVYSVIEN